MALAAWLAPTAQAASVTLDDQVFDVAALLAPQSDASPASVTAGALDSRFAPFSLRDTRRHGGAFWLKLRARHAVPAADVPVLVAHKGRHFLMKVFTAEGTQLGQIEDLPSFRAAQDVVF